MAKREVFSQEHANSENLSHQSAESDKFTQILYLPHGQKNIGHRKHQRKVDAVKKPQDIELYQRRNVLLYLPVGTRAFVSLFFCLLCAILFLQGHH